MSEVRNIQNFDSRKSIC